MEVCKMILFKGVIFRFYVSLRGSIYHQPSEVCPSGSGPPWRFQIQNNSANQITSTRLRNKCYQSHLSLKVCVKLLISGTTPWGFYYIRYFSFNFPTDSIPTCGSTGLARAKWTHPRRWNVKQRLLLHDQRCEDFSTARARGGEGKDSHRIQVWYIYLHLVDFYGKCREIYHTWILWDWMCCVLDGSDSDSDHMLQSQLGQRIYTICDMKHGDYVDDWSLEVRRVRKEAFFLVACWLRRIRGTEILQDNVFSD